jgi:probable HAF family extracellular repeat protein
VYLTRIENFAHARASASGRVFRISTSLDDNDREQIVGVSDLHGDTTFHAFVWTKGGRMRDLGTLPGDVDSIAFGNNRQGDIVGESCPASGNCRAFLWKNGVMADLNSLVHRRSSLYLTMASSINSHGEIVGTALDKLTGVSPGFLAIPETRN